MTCKLCDKFWHWLWAQSDAWEKEHFNWGHLGEETEQNRALIEQATALAEDDPAEAFRLYLEAAENGSAWSAGRVAWQYQTGTGVAADDDKAMEFYRRAIRAGSWMATIDYARLLAEHGHHDGAERGLKDGIACDFVPAYFWLAWLRYQRASTRQVCREVRPLLEYAASRGHPGAQFTLARWMSVGKFGLGEIPRGLKSGIQICIRLDREAAFSAR